MNVIRIENLGSFLFSFFFLGDRMRLMGRLDCCSGGMRLKQSIYFAISLFVAPLFLPGCCETKSNWECPARHWRLAGEMRRCDYYSLHMSHLRISASSPHLQVVAFLLTAPIFHFTLSPYDNMFRALYFHFMLLSCRTRCRAFHFNANIYQKHTKEREQSGKQALLQYDLLATINLPGLPRVPFSHLPTKKVRIRQSLFAISELVSLSFVPRN